MADVKIRVGASALNTFTGSQDLTISGFGTPKAIVGFVYGTTSTDTRTDDGIIGVFLADDSGNAASISCYSEHGQANADESYTNDIINAALRMVETPGGGVAFAADIDSDDATAGPITDGWRIDITDAPANAWKVVYCLFGGADLSAAVWQSRGSTTGTTVTVGFQAEAMMCFQGFRSTTTDGGGMNLSGGFWDGSTHTGYHAEANDGVGTTQTRAGIMNSVISGPANGTSVSHTYTITDVTSTTFDTTTSKAPSVFDCDNCGIALNLSGLGVDTGVIDSPTTAASDWTVSAPAFEPQFAMIVTTALTTITDRDANADGNVGYGVIDTDNSAYFGEVNNENAQSAASDTSTIYAAQWIHSYDGDDTEISDIAPAASPFNANGWTVSSADIAVANGTARKWAYFAIETDAAAGVTGNITGSIAAPVAAITGHAHVHGDITGSIAEPVAALTGTVEVPTVTGNITGSIAEPVASLTGSAEEVTGNITATISGPTASLTGTAPRANLGGWATNQARLRRIANLRRDDDEVAALLGVILERNE